MYDYYTITFIESPVPVYACVSTDPCVVQEFNRDVTSLGLSSKVFPALVSEGTLCLAIDPLGDDAELPIIEEIGKKMAAKDYEGMLGQAHEGPFPTERDFGIAVYWEMYGRCHISAKNLAEATRIAMDESGLPDGEYVEESFQIDTAVPAEVSDI